MILNPDVIQLFKLVNDDLNKISFEFNKKNSLYTPLFSTAIDHCLSIHILESNNLYSSSFALARPVLESYLRAMWVKFHLNENQIDEGCEKLHFPKNIDVLISDIKAHEYNENILFVEKQISHTIANLHDFTHGGIQSMARQYDSDGNLTNAYSSVERKELLMFTLFITKFSYVELSKFIETPNNELILKCAEKLINKL